jgi:uncharacterized membrane protein
MKRDYFIAGILLTLTVLAASAILYPHLPPRVPTHWNIHGRVDGYGAKEWAVFLGPGIMAAMLVLFRLLPWLSPRHFAVDAFRATYLYIMFVLLVFFGYVHALTLWAALTQSLNVGRAILGGLFLLLALLGNLLGKVQRNFYIGVRTPWTIANERVWNATHRLAAKLFVAAGLLGFLVVVAAGWTVASFIVLMIAVLVPVIYSLVYYKQLERRGEL